MTAGKREWRNGEEVEDGSISGLREFLTSRRTQFALLLYVLFPLFAGFISAMQGSGRTSGWPLGFRIAYYLPLALIVMWSSGLACHLLARIARALRMPLWVLLVAGVLAAGEVIKAYVRFVVPLFDKLLPASATGGRVVEFTMATTIQTGLPTIVTWLLLNMLAWKVFGIPRFGYDAPPGLVSSKWSRTAASDSEERAPPNFLARARLGSIDTIEAIEAQQHYIKIHAKTGQKTILYRFGDAIAEIEDDMGVQVHRSWWVNKKFVERLAREGDRMFVIMESGLEVPVSRTYAREAKEQFD
ncbi:LytTR family DNA-binding domain-containing protein [Altererythrobacter sp. GH1-8]|uniref:LytTR family DNA-binding domain-containing protein n=1 Tax=Altererythrobacter sp. GH1-8 TaxID=3349333 RepID=UPI00374CB7F0